MGWYWLAWIFLGFGIPEGLALIFNKFDTLSWQFWGLERIDFSHPYQFSDWYWLHWLIAIFVLVFLVWLLGHIDFGIWRG